MNKLKNRLLENISYLNKKDKINEGVEMLTDNTGEKHYFRDDDIIAYAFGYINDDLILSKNHGTHGEAVKYYLNMKDSDMNYGYFDRIYRSLKYEGRLWISFDTIAFRDSYIPEHIIIKLKKDLKNYFPNKDFSNFKVETKGTLAYAH